MDGIDLLRRLARNNAWANHRLLAACAELSEREYKARRDGFFPSIHLTLNHILEVDIYYLDALTSTTTLPSERGEVLHEAFAGLAEAQQLSDRRFVDFCETLDEAGLDRPVILVRAGGKRYRERVEDVVLHLAQHQVHHRGQVHAMLSGTSVAPPQLDEFFLRQDLPLRRAELEALCWPTA
jgi:uncharacterized damage-inducible protein DinB